MLHLFPTEVALLAISYLPIQSLRSVTLVSHAWNDVITINELTVYRNAAILHRFIDEDQNTVPHDWKAYCRRQLQIEQGWRGKAPAAVLDLTATGTDVHRIKVDYELGLVITTHQGGGLSVCDIEKNRVLWALPPNHVVQFAHCEYDHGYIVFNRYDNCKEIWRRSIDADADTPQRTSPPDGEMLAASAEAAKKFCGVECHRGHFKPWALLRLPELVGFFRLSYPTLLAASKNNAYIWNVSTSQSVSVIKGIRRPYHGWQQSSAPNYVEVNDLYVFICSRNTLRIFSRERVRLLCQLSSKDLPPVTWDVKPQSGGLSSSVVQPQMLLHYRSHGSFQGSFMACHVSASGKDLAVLTSNGKLVVLPNFQRLFSESNTVYPRDIAIVLNFPPALSDQQISRYLAVGSRNGKFAVATRNGVFVVSTDFDFNRVTAERPSELGRLTVCRLSSFDDDNLLSLITCLQITHDAVYVTYKPAEGQYGNRVDRGPVGIPTAEEPLHTVLHNLLLRWGDSTVYRVGF